MGRSNFDDPSYRRHENYRTGDHFVVGGVPVALGWNTDIVPDGLTNLRDLLTRELAGGLLGARDDIPDVLASVADADQPDDAALTPEAVAECQERWGTLFL